MQVQKKKLLEQLPALLRGALWCSRGKLPPHSQMNPLEGKCSSLVFLPKPATQ